MTKVMMSSATPVIKDGITNVMLNLYKKIDKEKYHIDFITINEPEESIKKQIFSNGGKYTVVQRSIKHPLRYIKEYSRACKGYDIVHVHGNSATLFLEMLAAKLAGVKVRIAHSHNTYCRFKKVDKILRILFYMTCNERLACGREAGEWLFGKKIFTIINNGIDCQKYSFDAKSRRSTREDLEWVDAKVIGHVGNFLPAKNHEFIVDVFEELIKRDSSFRLLLLGDGELYDSIKKSVSSKGLEDFVTFAGSVTNVNGYLSTMDIIFMPSINEGLPLTLIEAQANGLRCVVSDNITQDVNLTANVYFMSLSVAKDTWADAICDLMKSGLITDRKKISDESISKIASCNYDINRSVSLLEKIYKKRMEKK